MRPLRYSINVTLDGCCDHRAIVPDEACIVRQETIARADALLFGRVTYEMMEAAWRARSAGRGLTGWNPGWNLRPDVDAAKDVVSSTLERVDWNAELLRGDLGKAVQSLKRESGKGLCVRLAWR